MFHRNHLLLFALLFIIFAPAFFFSGNLPENVSASNTEQLAGYAWSSNMGWISFFSGFDPSVPAYGVKMNKANGELYGYAWSSNYGWVKFGPEQDQSRNITVAPENAPEDPKVWSYLDLNSNQLKGWARVCSVFKSGCTGALKDTPSDEFKRGGWDGWIKLSGNTSNGGSYGIKRFPDPITGKFHFFDYKSNSPLNGSDNLVSPTRTDAGAWGGGEVNIQSPGWITFNPAKVLTPPPVPPPTPPGPPGPIPPVPPVPPPPNDCSDIIGVHYTADPCPLEVWAVWASDANGNPITQADINQPVNWNVRVNGGSTSGIFDVKWSGNTVSNGSQIKDLGSVDFNNNPTAGQLKILSGYTNTGTKIVRVTVTSGTETKALTGSLTVVNRNTRGVVLEMDPFPKTNLPVNIIPKTSGEVKAWISQVANTPCDPSVTITVTLDRLYRVDNSENLLKTYSSNSSSPDYGYSFTTLTFAGDDTSKKPIDIRLYNTNNKTLWPAGKYKADFKVVSSQITGPNACIVQGANNDLMTFDLNISRLSGGETIEF